MMPFRAVSQLLYIYAEFFLEGLGFLRLMASSKGSLAAEVLFLRKQLAFYQERKIKPRRFNDSTRVLLVLLGKLFDWKNALVNVKPETFIGWHKQAFRLFWCWKSQGGRPRLPKGIRRLILEMAVNNPTWGQERIADELSLKLGILVSPRTVRNYWPHDLVPRCVRGQRWKTFVRNHANVVIACDFAAVVTARFRVLYVFVIMEVGTRRILHCNVTSHPTALWTVQQFREAIASDHTYRFLIHDRDSIFSQQVDEAVEGLGLQALRTPARAPQANAYCERLVGTIRRECLDFMIALSEKHLRRILREWVTHYNFGRPHSSLGPGLPIPDPELPRTPQPNRYQLPEGWNIVTRSVLSGLHHEYRLGKAAA